MQLAKGLNSISQAIAKYYVSRLDNILQLCDHGLDFNVLWFLSKDGLTRDVQSFRGAIIKSSFLAG